ncbi:unnamed protein product [Parascedosporium putredinis]|uniref:DJ-1/PfpI domain-containing protein n=1 Tax=Parascedosporium putredinis TaxID=1442378 RepID=A0A9P1M7P0_9PEZI|nr:unnamed protein product [Parascedosporium putredinis]CAI7990846.1 unnamed protein product [Parascedosporium putredinis]
MTNGTAPLRIAFVLFPAFAALDVFGPLGALNMASFEHPMTLALISTDLEPISIDRKIIDGFYRVDVIIVPGGHGTFDMELTQPHVDYLHAQMENPDLSYIMTVCTGASLLARTGAMAGRNATTNKAAFEWVQSVENATDINWIAKARWVVDGNLWTSSGVSAGTDMTLGWLEHLFGKNESERVRIYLEWNKLEQDDDPFAELLGLV